jgi:hypothetical protein
VSDKNTSTTSTKTSKGEKDKKVVPGNDETSSGAQEVNGQLINATGIGQNADQRQPDARPGEAVKGEKNKKTTEETIPGKEKAKNRRESSLESNKENDESDPKSNQDAPKAEKQTRPENDNKDKGKDKPKKKSGESKDADN